jgi:hypothetical protein
VIANYKISLKRWVIFVSRQVPEFRVSYTITTDKFDALYKKLKPKGVTMTALLAKAAGVALAHHPLLYACESHVAISF